MTVTKQKKQLKKPITSTNNEYQQAKEVVSTLELFKEVLIVANSIDNLRKYLREISKPIGKHYVTKIIDGKLQITRLK